MENSSGNGWRPRLAKCWADHCTPLALVACVMAACAITGLVTALIKLKQNDWELNKEQLEALQTCMQYGIALSAVITGCAAVAEVYRSMFTADATTSNGVADSTVTETKGVNNAAQTIDDDESCGPGLRQRRSVNAYENKRAVVIGVPEAADPDDTFQEDELLVAGLVSYCDNGDVQKAWQDGVIEHFRWPEGRVPGNRPLKIEMPTRALRDAFLASIRQKRAHPPPLPVLAYIRRDLSFQQLKLERAARGLVVEKNLAAGQLAYGLHDLAIIRYETPKPLPVDYGMGSLAINDDSSPRYDTAPSSPDLVRKRSVEQGR